MLSPSRTRLLVACMTAACLALGCDTTLPPAGPLDALVPTGIYIYQDADYSGASAHVTEELNRLGDYSGGCLKTCTSYGTYSCSSDWSACLSSVKVAPGWRATI